MSFQWLEYSKYMEAKMVDLPVTLTKYKSTSGDFSSNYIINKEDEIVEILSVNVVSPQFFKGTAERISIPFGDFLNVVSNMESDEALGYGTYSNDYEKIVDIVAKDEEDLEESKLSFSKENFKYHQHPGILLIDCRYLRRTKPAITPSLLLQTFINIDPQFRNAAYIYQESILGNMYLEDEDREVNKTFSLYFPVRDATDIPRYGKLLFDRLWLHGYGYIELSASGAMLVRSPINVTVFHPDYFDIVGRPVHDDQRFKCKKPETTYNSGEYLDTAKQKDLTSEEQKQLTSLIEEAKEEKQERSAKKRARLSAKHAPPPGRSYGWDIEKILNSERKELNNDFKLEFMTKNRKVSEVFYDDDEYKYNGEALADPIEGRQTGKLTARFWEEYDGAPIIQSFVNGEHITYYFSGREPRGKGWKVLLEENVDRFNKDHFNVMVNGKNRIMRREFGTGFSHDRKIYTFFARGDLSGVYDNIQIQIDEKKTSKWPTPVNTNILMAWITHPRANTYRGGVVFAPNQTVRDGYFNTWMGFGMKPRPAPNLLKRVYKHIEEVVCSGNSDLYNYFIRWIAYTMQNPDKQAGVAIVLRGEKGTGKSILGHFLRNIWGNHGLHITNPKHLVGNFNAHLADTCFLFADEAFFAGDKSIENILKGLVTEPMLMIERKGVDAIQQPNYLKILMVTNSEYVVPVSRDERRYCVIDVADTYRENNDENKKYFNGRIQLRSAIANNRILRKAN